MKHRRNILWIALLSILGSLCSPGDEPKANDPRLDALRSKRSEAIERAVSPIDEAYLRALTELREKLTRERLIHDAVQVDAEIDAVKASLLGRKWVKTPLGSEPGNIGRIEATNADTARLVRGKTMPLYRNADYKMMGWPEQFDGLHFTVAHNKHQGNLAFKVRKEGTVHLACSEIDIGNYDTTAASLAKDGWKRTKLVIKTDVGDFQVFRRDCKEGEVFIYQTAKYAAPIAIAAK